MAVRKNASGKKAVKKNLEKEKVTRRLRQAGYDKGMIDSLFEDQFPPEYDYHTFWLSDSMKAGAAQIITRLDPNDPDDSPVLEAFKIAGLDPRNLFNWQTVMSALCAHHFGPPKTAPVKWNDDAILKWHTDCEEAKRANAGLRTDLDLAKHLARHHPDYIGKFKTEKSFRHLTKRIEDAYNPKKNLRLRYPGMSDTQLMKLRAAQEARGVKWTAELEKQFIDTGERLNTVLRDRIEVAVRQHPQFTAVTRDAVEWAKPQLANTPQADRRKLVKEAAGRQPFVSLLDDVVESVMNSLAGDPQATKEP